MNQIAVNSPKQKKFFKRSLVYTIYLLLISIFFICALSTRTYIHEDGSYHNRNDVSLYLYTYKKLPSNYITKQESENSSYQPGDGKYIGGNTFYYRGAIKNVTANQNLRECDIEYPANEKTRGIARLVFTVDCTEIYYTNDHYKTFVFVSKWSINAVSNIFWIFFGTLITVGIFYSIYELTGKDETKAKYKNDAISGIKNFCKLAVYTIITPFVIVYMLINWAIKRLKRKND